MNLRPRSVRQKLTKYHLTLTYDLQFDMSKKKIDMSVTYEIFIGMSWKIFQVSHVSHMSQKKKTDL